jgi:hypothetical protein
MDYFLPSSLGFSAACSSFKYWSKRSKLSSQNLRYSSIHACACCIGLACNFNECIRPRRRRRINPAFSSTRRCFETAGNDMEYGRARSETHRSPCARCSRMRRRVGSASAAKVRFNINGEHLTIWLSINRPSGVMQVKFLPCCHRREEELVDGIFAVYSEIKAPLKG